ncbi:hypothetical protein [Staphylococcus succinus]|uniref:hypothetical protein n=1 Tax=Staphylococcus succinus TaxID=61015 RepID=UPI000E67F0F6|nr:hypothetical protein [Staphylococcus succinus]RIN41906.1 hypothetical protein BU059_08945 [Staphylococcus succinus]
MNKVIPVLYFIPFTFLGIFTDYLSFTIIGYIIFGVMLITLNMLSIGQYNAVIVALLNIISMGSSLIFSIFILNSNEQVLGYFKPVTPIESVVIDAAIIYLISLLIPKLITYLKAE